MIKIVRDSIKKSEVEEIAKKGFGDFVKVVVDTEQEIMIIGSELHSDGELELSEKENSKRENTWGVNIYPKKQGDELIEFDSMINLKPQFNNRSRGVENESIRAKIREIVKKLIIN